MEKQIKDKVHTFRILKSFRKVGNYYTKGKLIFVSFDENSVQGRKIRPYIEDLVVEGKIQEI